MNKIEEFDMLRHIIGLATGVDVKNKCKKTEFVYARMVFYVIARSNGSTFQTIGQYVGKDHATVIVALRQFNNLVTQDRYLRELYFECSKSFRERTEPIRVIGNMPRNSFTQELQYRIDSLILENERLQKSKGMYKRFKDIVKDMDERTPHGMEPILHERIIKVLNGDIFK